MLSQLAKLSGVAILSFALAGCWYDYAQNSDRVVYGAGDSVKANLEAQTTNPSSDEQYDVDDLGADGRQIEDEAAPDQ